MSSSTALKTFSLTNDIIEISPQDEIYRFDAAADKRINNEQPWKKE
jgi:COP9 signalosome complex subunit 5